MMSLSLSSSLLFLILVLLLTGQQQKQAIIFTNAIIGGRIAPKGKYPSIVWSGSQGRGWGCGGSMIYDDIFITAAHCRFAFEEAGGAYVGVYISKDNSKDNDHNPNWYEIDTLITHPKHKIASPYNDIMLVKLMKPQQRQVKNDNNATDTTDPPQLPYYNINRDPTFPSRPIDNKDHGGGLHSINNKVGIVGFGVTDESGEDGLSSVLKENEVYVYDYQSCYDVFAVGGSDYENPFSIDDTLHICTGDPNGGNDACDSDSGTPILATTTSNNNNNNNNNGTTTNNDNEDDDVVIVGIINDGIGCGRPDTPAFNARVSAFADWIDASICQLSGHPPARCNNNSSGNDSTNDSTNDGTNTTAIYSKNEKQQEDGTVITFTMHTFVTGMFLAFIVGGISVYIWMTTTNNCCGSFGFFGFKRLHKRSYYDKLGEIDNGGKYYNGGIEIGNDDDDDNMTARTIRSSISSKRSSFGNY